jgi:hypothetical protein
VAPAAEGEPHRLAGGKARPWPRLQQGFTGRVAAVAGGRSEGTGSWFGLVFFCVPY